jgi:hypothetical protein
MVLRQNPRRSTCNGTNARDPTFRGKGSHKASIWLATLRQADGWSSKKGYQALGDSRNIEQIREILRMQFDAAAADAADPTRISILRELSATTSDIPAAMIEAYWEIFEGLRDTELEHEMLRGIGTFWWPESATNFVERFISISTGGDRRP